MYTISRFQLTICNLYIVNYRTEPTFETRRGSSYADLTIIHSKIRKVIQEPPDMADDKALRKEEIIANFKN